MSSLDIEVTETLDCIGLLCPMPIYKASLVMKRLSPGDVLKVLSTDSGSVRDFPAFVKQAEHELLATADEDDVHVFFIRKGGE